MFMVDNQFSRFELPFIICFNLQPVDLPVSRDNSEMNATTKGVGYVRGHRCNGTQSTLVAETQFSPVGTSRDIPSTSVELYPGQGGNTYPYVIFQPEPLKPTSSAPLSAYGKPPAIPGSVRKFGSPPATSLPYTSYQHDTYNYPMLNDDRSMRGYSGSLQRPSNFVGQPRPTSYTGGRRETSPITAAPVGNPGIIVGNPGRYGSQAEKRESVGSLKLPSYVHPVPLPSHKSKTDIIERAQCFYCKIWFRRDQNERGSCPEAPDVCELWLQRLTCLWCANCAVYCCLREDGEGPAQRGSHVCACDSEDSNCCARWSIMGLLSLFVPCLWLYLPAKACHLCCRSCSMCGGRHKAM